MRMNCRKPTTRDFVRLTYNREARPGGARKNDNRTSGIYGLVDPREPDRIRYIGSSCHIERRLYDHAHSTNPSDRHPRSLWLRTLKAEGIKPEALILEICEVGKAGSPHRHDVEAWWISTLAECGEADLNARLMPGYVRTQALQEENAALREQIRQLQLEIRAMRLAEDLV